MRQDACYLADDHEHAVGGVAGKALRGDHDLIGAGLEQRKYEVAAIVGGRLEFCIGR